VRGNPFTYGNPISDPRRFVGREYEVRQIFSRLSNKEFESSSVVGDHRIGKTSLLKHVANPRVWSTQVLGSKLYSFIYVDLAIVDAQTEPAQLWRHLLALVQQNCTDPRTAGLLEKMLDHERLQSFELDRLFCRTDDLGHHVVFLLDEFERITDNENFGPDFYNQLRSYAIQHKIALVTSSRQELIRLCRDDRVKSSPFFNIFANINLPVFSHVDFELMVSQSLDGTSIKFSSSEMTEVLDLAGLHPYFSQAACHMLFESYGIGVVEPVARRDFLTRRFRAEAIPHIENYWDNSSDEERIVLTAGALLERTSKSAREFSLEALQQLYGRGDQFVEVLEKRGLLMSRGSRYWIFSSVVGPWIISQITAELSEEQSYQQWLAKKENKDSVEKLTGRPGKRLRESLPKISSRYRHLFITWASDPKSVASLADLLQTVLTQVK
jgi:hypothetical protein